MLTWITTYVVCTIFMMNIWTHDCFNTFQSFLHIFSFYHNLDLMALPDSKLNQFVTPTTSGSQWSTYGDLHVVSKHKILRTQVRVWSTELFLVALKHQVTVVLPVNVSNDITLIDLTESNSRDQKNQKCFENLAILRISKQLGSLDLWWPSLKLLPISYQV